MRLGISTRPAIIMCGALLAGGLLPARTMHAQTLQLPTFSYFATDSSVMVPDQGSAAFGGVNRSSSGSNQFGPPFLRGNRSYGSQSSAGQLRVSAQIHDFQAMDEALLGNDGLAAGKNAGGSLTLIDDLPPMASVAELAARKAAGQAAEQAAAAQLLERGRKAQAEGKLGVAKVYLQMAAKRASGDLKQQILAALAGSAQPAAAGEAGRKGQNDSSRSVARKPARSN